MFQALYGIWFERKTYVIQIVIKTDLGENFKGYIIRFIT